MLALTRHTSTTSLRSAAAQILRSSRPYATNSHMNDGKPQTIEKEKQKTLKGENDSSVEGAPGWNEQLASQSEAQVKASKNPKGPEELQAETSKVKERDHPHGEAANTRTSGDQPTPKNV